MMDVIIRTQLIKQRLLIIGEKMILSLIVKSPNWELDS